MNTKYSVLFFVLALVGLLSCKNNDNVFPKTVSSYINVVNASADTINFYLNGTRQNNTSSLFPGGQSFYITVPAGAQNYSFKKAGTQNVLFTINLNLQDSIYHTVYVTSEAASGAFSSIDTLIRDSALTAVRFVNASPDAGVLSVSVGDTVKFNNRAFKTTSRFFPVGSGQKRVRIYLAGASAPKVDTTITMQPDRGYTLFSRGLLNGKGNAVFDVGLALNF